MPLAEFNEVNETPAATAANLNKTFRIAGLVTDAQHRMTRNGKNFGSITIEDFTAKTEIMLWSDDYMRFKHYVEAGKNLRWLTGYFRARYNTEQYEFKVNNICLLETAKQTLYQAD